MSATPRWRPRPPTWASTSATCCTPAWTSSVIAETRMLLELELVEPSLGWRQLDGTTRNRQQREFALGVESALERLGLGPLSHRRP